MKTIKIGLIGVYHRGELGLGAHRPEEGFEVVIGADVAKDKFKNFEEKLPNARQVLDWREVINDSGVDAVFVTVPDFMHEEVACAALEAGKAVYLEKPIAITIEGADRILRTAYKTGSKLFLGHNMRYFSSVLKMKEIIDSGLIGDVQCGWCRHFISYGGDAYFRDWHSERRYSNGLLLQKGAHDIDVMHWLMGSYTKRVVGMGMLSVYDKLPRRAPGTEVDVYKEWTSAHYPPVEQSGFSPIIDVEDHNMVMMQLANGAQATYMQCHYAPDAERNYTFIGTRGRVENIGDHGNCQIHVWTTRGSRANPDVVYYLKPENGTHGGADPKIISAFLAFIRDGKVPSTSPVAARMAVATGVLGHYSMRNGNVPQDVPQLEPELIAYFENGQKK